MERSLPTKSAQSADRILWYTWRVVCNAPTVRMENVPDCHIWSVVNKKINQQQLRNLIREELARGVPDWVFSELSEDIVKNIELGKLKPLPALIQISEQLFKILIDHANRSSTDTTIRNRRYSTAQRLSQELRVNQKLLKIINNFEDSKEVKQTIEDSLKQALLIYLAEAV